MNLPRLFFDEAHEAALAVPEDDLHLRQSVTGSDEASRPVIRFRRCTSVPTIVLTRHIDTECERQVAARFRDPITGQKVGFRITSDRRDSIQLPYERGHGGAAGGDYGAETLPLPIEELAKGLERVSIHLSVKP